MQAGDQIQLNLDQVSVPEFPTHVFGVVQMPVLQVNVHDPECDCLVNGTRYQIEYETDDLNGALPELRACDVLSQSCVTCCQVADEKFTAITEAETAARIAADDALDGRVTTLEAVNDRASSDLRLGGATFDPQNPIVPPLGDVDVTDKQEGDSLVVTYDPDSLPGSGDETVVRWTFGPGGVLDPSSSATVLELPEAQVVRTETPQGSGIFLVTFTSKLGNQVSWTERPVTASRVESEVSSEGINTLTHQDGLGNEKSWISVDPKRVIFHNGNIVSGSLEVVMWDPNTSSFVTKFIPIADAP